MFWNNYQNFCCYVSCCTHVYDKFPYAVPEFCDCSLRRNKKIYLWKSYILMSGYAISLTWRTLVERVLYLESWTREFQINFDFFCEIKCLCISHLIFVWWRHLCCLKINKSLSDFIPRKIIKHFCPRSQELLALAVQ